MRSWVAGVIQNVVMYMDDAVDQGNRIAFVECPMRTCRAPSALLEQLSGRQHGVLLSARSPVRGIHKSIFKRQLSDVAAVNVHRVSLRIRITVRVVDLVPKYDLFAVW